MDLLAWWAIGVYIATLSLPFIMLLIVPNGRKPSSAIAWLLVIAILPWIGLFLFLLLGHPRLPRQRRRRLKKMARWMREDIKQAVDDPEAPFLRRSLPDEFVGIATMAEHLGALPPFRGNAVEILDDYDAIFDAMINDIRQASRYVHLQSYIFALDDATRPLLEALRDARRRGVSVRILLDHLGSRGFAKHRRLLRFLDEHSLSAAYMLPFQPLKGRFARPDLRNHRKLLVVDGDVGYIGSQNLIDKAYKKRPWSKPKYEYLEIVARTRGPIDQQLDAVFKSDWYAETGDHLTDESLPQVEAGDALAQVLPSGPGHAHESNLRVFNALLYRAQERIVIVNAYFVPDATLMMALTAASQRGVEVILITPKKGNQWLLNFAQASYYGELLRAGVKIYQHPRPWNLHSKTMRIDDDVCVIGSSNLDIRSFELNLEVSLLCYDSRVVADLAKVEAQYIAASTELTLDDWHDTPAWRRAAQNVARLTSALQ